VNIVIKLNNTESMNIHNNTYSEIFKYGLL